MLFEVSSFDRLVHYFASIQKNDIFEVEIDEVQNSTLPQNYAHETKRLNLSSAVAIYSLLLHIETMQLLNSNTFNLPTLGNLYTIHHILIHQNLLVIVELLVRSFSM